ncbi:GNAT family N-acetyltransferase [Anaerobacillus sp. CMMVII]|uniref:GNAT family N-acetyltransferase n=1 Tax=Anaerobacillus sp. CMMVII TaxID=2755588 RepID=UPI0021B7F9F9|nr:GNAT family N-acetyltransferase [Anaerobacillus sp. CMMVII]MCT8136897.1 GNAT family N-acetyltransferase [Anaerobacillus sp. CMMVII]
MLYLELIDDPLDEGNLLIQEEILNSDPYFLKNAEGKQALTKEDIIEELLENTAYEARFYFIKNDNEHIGLIYYIPDKPQPHYGWLSLFIIHKNYQQHGLGKKSYQLFEDLVKKELLEVIRLCAQVENKRGGLFWRRNGYHKIGTTWDKKQHRINVYEKVL